jgi:hypothetical protein
MPSVSDHLKKKRKQQQQQKRPVLLRTAKCDRRNLGSTMSFKRNKERGGGGGAMSSKAKSGKLLATIESGDNGTRI